MMKIQNWFIVVSIIAFACGCNRHDRSVKNHPTLTVSLAPLEWFVSAIGGDSVNVNVLLPSGSNPESFEPGMSAVRAASESDALIISGGLPFERSLSEKIGAETVVDVSEGIAKLYGTHDHCSHTHSGHGHQGESDPHIWTSVKNGRTIAENIYTALVDIDPANADYYKGRYEKLITRLDSLDAIIGGRLAEKAGESIIVLHPSLGYFARDYGMKQISIGAEGKEMSIQGLKRQLDQAKRAGESVLLVQAEFDGRQAEAIARQVGVRVEMINLLNPDWEEELIRITDAIAGQ